MNIGKRFLRPSLVFKSGIASVDQAILSVLNFLISIILIRTAPQLEYGYYSIAFSITLFLASIQGAIVSAPLAVLLVTKKSADKKEYAASLCYGQFIAIVPMVFLGLIVIALLRLSGLDSTKAFLAGAVSVAVLGLLFREFLRSYFFAEENPLQVLKMDTLYGILFLTLIALIYSFLRVRASTVFLLIGIVSLLVALLFSRKRGWEYSPQSIRKSYRENWKLGKWALVGVCVTHIQNYSYLYLLGALLGSAAVAEVSAARLLLAPLLLVQVGWGQIVVPHGSRLREHTQVDRFFKEQIVASLIFVIGIAAYVGLLLTFSEVIQRLLLTKKYANSFDYLLLWGTVFIIRFIALNASYGLQVIKSFHTISKVNFITMLVTVGCAYFFIPKYGIAGGLMSLIIGGILLAISLWYCFGKMVFSYRLVDQRTRQSGGKIVVNFSKRGSVSLLED